MFRTFNQLKTTDFFTLTGYVAYKMSTGIGIGLVVGFIIVLIFKHLRFIGENTLVVSSILFSLGYFSFIFT